MLDSNDISQVTQIIESAFRTYGIAPKTATSTNRTSAKAKPSREKTSIQFRTVSKKKMPREFWPFAAFINEAISIIDYAWLSNDVSTITGINGSCVDVYGGKIGIAHGVVSAASIVDFVKEYHDDSLMRHQSFDWKTGELYEDKLNQEVQESLSKAADLPAYRLRNILKDAHAIGCFPNDIKLIRGVGFVLTPCHHVSVDDYRKEQRRRSS